MAIHMMKLGLPGTAEVWEAFGRVAIRCGQLEHMVKMLVKTIEELSPQEAREATRHMTAREIRERVRKLAKQKDLGESVYCRLDVLLNSCWRASDRRNELIHNIYGEDRYGNPITLDKNHHLTPMPTVAELSAFEQELNELVDAINHARTEGFLAEALKKKQKLKPKPKPKRKKR